MAAILSFIGALAGAVIGFVGSWLLLKYNYKDLFAKTVSSNRMDWINKFRDEIAMVIGTIRILKHSEPPYYDYRADILKAEQARVRLLTRLNMSTERFGNEYNEVFAARLEALNFYDADKVSEDDMQKLIELTRKILEPEWQRVKSEAKGEQR